jgi:hypothetical protein
MTHQRYAQLQHPKLYKLGQHGLIRILHDLVWSPKVLRTAKRLRTPVPRVPRAPRAYTPRTHSTMIVHGNVYFN